MGTIAALIFDYRNALLSGRFISRFGATFLVVVFLVCIYVPWTRNRLNGASLPNVLDAMVYNKFLVLL